MSLVKISKRESITEDDKIRAAGDILGSTVGAIGNIAHGNIKSKKDIIRKGALGAFFGLETGDGLGDMVSWLKDKRRALTDIEKAKRKKNNLSDLATK